MNKGSGFLFSDILLCVSLDGKNFKCKQFDSFLEADDYYRANFKNTPNEKSTMIKSCKFMPDFIRQMKTNRQLEKIFNPRFKTKIIQDVNNFYL